MSPGPATDPRQLEEEVGLDVGMEPGAGLGYPVEGDIRIISREIYQGKTFDDWDDMEANVRRLARKAGFKVVKVNLPKQRTLHTRQQGCFLVPHQLCTHLALLQQPCDKNSKQSADSAAPACWLGL